MTTAEVPSDEAQQVVVELLDLPDEVLKYIAQYVPRLEALAVANQRLGGIALEVNDERQVKWLEYYEGVTTNLDLDMLRSNNSFDAVCAWILLADEYTTEMENTQTGELMPAANDLKNALPGIITTGLQSIVATQVSAQVMAHGEDSIDQSVSDAYGRLMQRWVD